MDETKKNLLEARGWRVAGATEFLDLTPEEAVFVELKLALGELIRSIRKEQKLTQSQLAEIIKSSQSRVARLESGDSSVTIDRQIRSLLVLGAPPKKLAQVFDEAASQVAM